MNKVSRSPQNILFNWAFLIYVVLFFLSLGADYPGHFKLRFWYGIILLVFFILLFRRQISLKRADLFPVLFLGLFLLFQILRAVWGLAQAYLLDGIQIELYLRYAEAPFKWSLYLGLLIVSMNLVKKKSVAQNLMVVMASCGFFLAVNALPSLLQGKDLPGYLVGEQYLAFFFPFFYAYRFIPDYILSIYSQPNFMGDIIALGFYPFIGILVYTLWTRVEDSKKRQIENPVFSSFDTGWLAMFLLKMIAVALTGAAVILILSRGTMVAFGVSLLFYFFVLLLKLREFRYGMIGMALLLVTGFVFFSLSVDWQRVSKEMQTLKREEPGIMSDPNKNPHASFSVSTYTLRAGAHRALSMYHHYPLWGVGTGGYRFFSDQFSRNGVWKELVVARFQAMNHYLQILAEEGVGAYLYFLFLMAYFGLIFKRLIGFQSRFQFVVVLSLFAPILMVFLHAAINDLMQRFSTSMLIYITMGASLGISSSQFEHQS